MTKKGPRADFFNATEDNEDNELMETVEEGEELRELPALSTGTSSGFLRKEIENMRAHGVNIDDDTEPAPENLPGDDPNECTYGD